MIRLFSSRKGSHPRSTNYTATSHWSRCILQRRVKCDEEKNSTRSRRCRVCVSFSFPF